MTAWGGCNKSTLSDRARLWICRIRTNGTNIADATHPAVQGPRSCLVSQNSMKLCDIKCVSLRCRRNNLFCLSFSPKSPWRWSKLKCLQDGSLSVIAQPLSGAVAYISECVCACVHVDARQRLCLGRGPKKQICAAANNNFATLLVRIYQSSLLFLNESVSSLAQTLSIKHMNTS